jgi:hypothetical protein
LIARAFVDCCGANARLTAAGIGVSALAGERKTASDCSRAKAVEETRTGTPAETITTSV